MRHRLLACAAAPLACAAALLACAAALLACGQARQEPAAAPEEPAAAAPEEAAAPAGPDRAAARQRAQAIFAELPDAAVSPDNPITAEKVDLGRMLYYDARFSRSQQISCNSCHELDGYGVDGEPTSPGHRGQRGDRNSPTVYNAALHLAQFWDGRAADVEEQAKGPVLNPVEMAMPSEDYVLEVLRSIPGYAPAFAAAFPEDADPIDYDNMARAIGAFERQLLTPSRFDAFLAGEDTALNDAEVAGLVTFMDVGCIQCHNGPPIGGKSFQKLGRAKPYPTQDPGRFKVTGQESDRFVFKVPSLRNIERTGPYLHDGSIGSLDEMIRIMGEHQLGTTLSPAQVESIRSFLGALTGEVDLAYIERPELPASGPDTPKPDES
jgi:cytochrome c peroxidase